MIYSSCPEASVWADYLVVTESYVVTSLCTAIAFIFVMHKLQLSNNLSFNKAKFEITTCARGSTVQLHVFFSCNKLISTL